jgi:diguanylate cyclase (GGDEF)-like protein
LLPVQAIQCGVLIVLYFLFRQVRAVQWARLLTLAGYAFFCMGAAAVMAIASYNQFGDDDGALRAVQFTILASYGLIMLSILLLPYSLWESLTVALLIAASLLWSLWWSVPTLTEPLYLSQLFTLGCTMLIVMCIAHFQNALRRRVFEAAFELADSAAQLQRLTVTDAVTEGYNRRYLETVLNGEIARAARFAHTLSVIMFDLDNFKRVNDTLGHNTGDEVLREVWRATAATVREVDTVARYGGDEFVIILPETDREAALSLAMRLQQNTREYLSGRFGENSIEAGVTLSIGLFTLCPAATVTFEYVIEQADERLYQAKRQGKNRIAA